MAFRGMPARLSELIADIVVGGTIVGSKIKTALTGERLEIGTSTANGSQISMYTGDPGETSPATVLVDATVGADGQKQFFLILTAPHTVDSWNAPLDFTLMRRALTGGGDYTEANIRAQALKILGDTSITGSLTVGGYAAGQRVVARNQLGAAGGLLPVGVLQLIYSQSVAVPAGARSVHVVGRAQGRSSGESDVTWTMEIGGVVVDSAYLYNAADFSADLSAALFGVEKVDAIVTPTLTLKIFGQAGGTAFTARQGSFSVTFLK